MCGDKKMKKNILLILMFLFSENLFSQEKSFNFTDEKFEAGAMRSFDAIYYCLKCGKVDHMHCYSEFDIYCGGQSDASSKSMDSLIAFLYAHPEISVEVSNHTDVRGSFTYNMKLSGFKLISLTTRIKAAGISSSQITFMAYGESNPLISEKLIKKMPKGEREKAYKSNERTYLRIVAVDGSYNKDYIKPLWLNKEETKKIFGDADSVVVMDKYNYVFFEEKISSVLLHDKDSLYTKLIDFKSQPRSYAVSWRKGDMWIWIKLTASSFEQAINLSTIKKPKSDVNIHELKPHIEFDFR